MTTSERQTLMEQALPEGPTDPDAILDFFARAVLGHPRMRW
jgi:hypothetical protein